MSNDPSSSPEGRDQIRLTDRSSGGRRFANQKASSKDLDELRRLLFEREYQQLEEARRRIEVLEQKGGADANRISEVLPEAVAIRTQRDGHLANALAPTIEDTLRVSIRRNPQPMVDALFPVIGPAIRKSIAEALSSTMDAVNRTLEHSFSAQGLKWRLEAMRTGRPFSEVVLSHTLQYRVEQIFVIDNETGLPLVHVHDEAAVTQDGALVSSMLTAIQDFFRDSFSVDRGEGLERLEYGGDLTILIEPGPRASLAAVVRGVPGPQLEEEMRTLIEGFHFQCGQALLEYDGDTAPFESAIPMLTAGLQEQYQTADNRKKSIGPWLFGAVVVGLVALVAFFVIRDRVRWNAFVEQLDAEPGIVVTDTGKAKGARYVRGMRDPLSADPEILLAASPFDTDDVRFEWESYTALDAEMLTRRAREVLLPPESAQISVLDGRIYAAGVASTNWIREARDRARALAGLAPYDDIAIEDAAVRDLLSRADRIEQSRLRFGSGRTNLLVEDRAALADVAEQIRSLDLDARAVGKTVHVVVHGSASSDGSAAINQLLIRERSDAIRAALIGLGVSETLVSSSDIPAPSVTAIAAADEQRRVDIRVRLY